MPRPSNTSLQFIAGNPALDFCNTVADRLGLARERLTSGEAVRQWARTAGILDEDEPLELDEAGLEAVRGAREAIYAVMQPLSTGASPDEALLAPLNTRLVSIVSHRALKSEDGGVGWRWTFAPETAERLTAPLLTAAAELLASGAWRRVRQCNDKHCGWLFLDQSKAGRRRWCSMADCGNRAKAARHHRRLKAG
jgi:predicted RNA-binding Zn ribbon-like protein